jgi:hypothetical protein
LYDIEVVTSSIARKRTHEGVPLGNTLPIIFIRNTNKTGIREIEGGECTSLEGEAGCGISTSTTRGLDL